MSEDQRLFGKRCAGFDCWAQKGCVYARIDVEERPCHIIGIHAQAHEKHRSIREQQFQCVKQFITSLRIPATEPVILAGDFNVNLFKDSIDQAYTTM